MGWGGCFFWVLWTLRENRLMLNHVNNLRSVEMKMSSTDSVALLVVIIGGINWGLVGFFKWNLVDKIFGVGSSAARVVYCVVGVVAVYMVIAWLAKMAKSA